MGQNANWLREKLEQLDNRMDEQLRTLDRLTSSVEHHIERTNLLEVHLKKLEEELSPIKIHVATVGAFGKVVGVVGIVVGILKSFNLF